MSQKIKIKDWKGLYTNIDENDSRFELVRFSDNFAHEVGFIETIPRYLSAESGLPTLPTGFTWETGIYCVLASDELTDATPVAGTSYNCLVLIAKKLDTGIYLRRIHLHDGTNWHELSSNSTDISGIDIENHDGAGAYGNSYFSTTLDGEAFFIIERGRLKLFLPHQSFWIGKIERTTLQSFLTHNDWYIDRLVELFKVGDQGILYNNFVTTTLPNGFTQANVLCSEGRRLGCAYTYTIEEDPTTTVENFPISKTLVEPADYYPDGKTIQAKAYKYSFTNTSTGASIINPGGLTTGSFEDDPDWLKYFFLYYKTGTGDACLNKIWCDKYLDPTSTTWAAISTEVTTVAIDTKIAGTPGSNDFVKATGIYVIPQATFHAQAFKWKSPLETTGFDPDEAEFDLVVTAVIDENDETIIRSDSYSAVVESVYAIKIHDIGIPNNINKRITRLRFYYKLTRETNYSLVKDFNLIDGKQSIDDFHISEGSISGTTLAGNIGFLFEHDRSTEYKILTGFKDFTAESDIGIGLTQSDLIGIYYSTIGGGNLMTDILYSQAKLPISGITTVNAVANINGKIGVFSNTTLYIIQVIDTSGLLTFTVNDTVEIGVKNRNDVVQVQGGVIANTRNGIFFTNGFEAQLISESINDIIKSNYSTGSVTYNAHKNELYYRPKSSEDNLYRYRFERKVWEMVTII